VLDLHGFLTFENTIEYWIENRIVLPFQNQSLAFVIKGNNFVLNGNDVGGIDGNGQQWYDYARDFGNKFGRPMSLAISDAKNVEVINWTVKQPQFWAIITIRTENVYMKDIYVNATSYNPEVSRMSAALDTNR
jgi:polygalacturonase